MQFIEKLQQTTKWSEFQVWFDKIYTGLIISGHPEVKFERLTSNTIYDTDIFITLLPFEFLKGVFEKFLDNQGYHLCSERRKNGNGVVIVPVLYRISKPGDAWTQCLINDNCDSFEELLQWYFEGI